MFINRLLPYSLTTICRWGLNSYYECLIEIKEDKKLEALHVAIFTTSITQVIDAEENLKKTLCNMGSQNYIRKPADFKDLVHLIHQAINKVIEKVD
jgi:hypothetical protein